MSMRGSDRRSRLDLPHHEPNTPRPDFVSRPSRPRGTARSDRHRRDVEPGETTLSIENLIRSGRIIDAIRFDGWQSREQREGGRFGTGCREVPKRERRSREQGALDSERQSGEQRAGPRMTGSPGASTSATPRTATAPPSDSTRARTATPTIGSPVTRSSTGEFRSVAIGHRDRGSIRSVTPSKSSSKLNTASMS
jgi:hypothetical protein